MTRSRPLPPVLSFVAPSGTGKTTYLEGLLPHLAERGLRVLVIKHDVHRFEVDREGKDSYRLREAGAHQVLLLNRDQMALMGSSGGDVPLWTLVERYGSAADLVITEGFRQSSAPKILVARAAARETLAPESIDPLVAAVTDHPLGLAVPEFPLGDPSALLPLIEQHLDRADGGPRGTTGVLLAGGRGQRLGYDKAQLSHRGRPLLPQLVERLAPLCSGGVLVVTRRDQDLPPLPSEARVVEDLLPQHAALGGLYTGLALAEAPYIFLAACDMPLLDAGLIEWMQAYPAPGADVLVPEHCEYLEPTHAIYGYRCLGAIKRSLLSGEFRLDGWFGSVRVERIPEASWRAIHPTGQSFANVNTPEDLERLRLALGEL